MEERESGELCDNCPLKLCPPLDRESQEMLSIYSDVNTPIGQAAMSDIIAAYKPGLNRFDYLKVIQSLNHIQRLVIEHDSKQKVVS